MATIPDPAGNATATPRSDAGGGAMTIRFWGVRGSLPTPGPSTLRYGGNTPCVSVRCGPHQLILDAGSGLKALGRLLAGAGAPVDADILLSHTHLDHICGLPFFRPFFRKDARIRLWAGHLTAPEGIEDAVLRSWRAPLMPDMDTLFRARISFNDFTAGDDVPLPAGPRVQSVPLRHPGNATGYRITWNNMSICYFTDTEHMPDGPDPALVRFAAGTDLLIYDSSYTDAEYRTRAGWGHSTWQAAVALAEAAGAGRLVLFHHDPDHDDDMMDAIGREAAARLPGTLVAAEGLELTPGTPPASHR